MQSSLNILTVDPLLGNDDGICNYTSAITKKILRKQTHFDKYRYWTWRVWCNNNWNMFPIRSVPSVISRTSLDFSQFWKIREGASHGLNMIKSLTMSPKWSVTPGETDRSFVAVWLWMSFVSQWSGEVSLVNGWVRGLLQFTTSEKFLFGLETVQEL
jgi:hypothetical protein